MLDLGETLVFGISKSLFYSGQYSFIVEVNVRSKLYNF